MKKIIVIDIGGTFIKYGLFDGEKLKDRDKVPTPTTWKKMKQIIGEIAGSYQQTNDEIIGVGISAPGAVNKQMGVILGDSAIPYIHGFNIVKELEDELKLKVKIENDAKCAALAELRAGHAKGLSNVVLLVLGSEIGGTIISNQKISYGKHLYSGEFGWMILDNQTGETLTQISSPVNMAKRYAKVKNIPTYLISAQTVFEEAEAGDYEAKEEIEKMMVGLSLGLYNISVTLDPECILIGGGISERTGFIKGLEERTKDIIKEKGVTDIQPKILPCKFFNSSNLIGAAFNFLEEIE